MPPLLRLAGELEAVRDHVLGRRRPTPTRTAAGTTTCSPRPRPRGTSRPSEDKAFTALGASAHLDQVIFDGASFGTGATPGTPEEEDYLGLPGLLDPDQVAALLRARQAKQVALQKKAPSAVTAPVADPDATHERRARCASSSTRWSPRTTIGPGGRTGRSTTSCAASAGDPRPPSAPIEQLEQRIATLQSW